MRTPFVAGNWKMHKSLAEAQALVRGIREGIGADPKVKVAICPPFTLLHAVHHELEGSSIRLGAQNVNWESKGAFTGDISAQMLRDAGCAEVIIGHSERRHVFGETNAMLAKKVPAAMEAGLHVIYCVGETLEEHEAGRTQAVVAQQLDEVITGDLDASKLTIAYEPVWAIGTGKTARPEQAQWVHVFVRGRLARIFDESVAASTVIQYGGSVKPNNAKELMSCPDVDGALVGGACLVAEDFAAIIAAAAEAQK